MLGHLLLIYTLSSSGIELSNQALFIAGVFINHHGQRKWVVKIGVRVSVPYLDENISIIYKIYRFRRRMMMLRISVLMLFL